tara:strand:+ start:1896 stop:2840 length:945 start_codon:yes stop_codon:yes gene_type:complete
MRRGKLSNKSLIFIILTATFTLLSYASDQMVIRSEDKLRNAKILLENKKNRNTQYETISAKFDAITTNVDLKLQSYLPKRNFLIKSIILLDDEIEISSRNSINIFSENLGEGVDAKRTFKWQIVRELKDIVLFIDAMAVDFADIYIYQEELIKKNNQNKIKQLKNLFFYNENIEEATLDLEQKLFYKDMSIYTDLYNEQTLTTEQTQTYLEWALENFTTKNYYDIYKYKMFLLKRLYKDSNKLGKFTEILDDNLFLIEDEIDDTLKIIQKININKNYFILSSILFQVVSLLFLLLLFKSFLIKPKNSYRTILTK